MAAPRIAGEALASLKIPPPERHHILAREALHPFYGLGPLRLSLLTAFVDPDHFAIRKEKGREQLP
jgi:hypothetical protein